MSTLTSIGHQMASAVHWDPKTSPSGSAGRSGRPSEPLTITTLNCSMAFIIWFQVWRLVPLACRARLQVLAKQLFGWRPAPALSGATLRLVYIVHAMPHGWRRAWWSASPRLAVDPAMGSATRCRNSRLPRLDADALALPVRPGRRQLLAPSWPTISLFFPRAQGSALGIHAGLGNFGVSMVQFLTPGIRSAFGMLGGESFMGDS